MGHTRGLGLKEVPSNHLAPFLFATTGAHRLWLAASLHAAANRMALATWSSYLEIGTSFLDKAQEFRLFHSSPAFFSCFL